MVKSVKSHLEEEDEPDDYDSSSYRGEVTKMDGKSSEQKTNTHRSKHSETEQRRRSKINERFQILRNLIPQNDQKRDKASFLLEVIEYIQFLQEKLQLYEGPCQGWSQEPTKLVPWKNQHSPIEGLMDHSPVLKNDSAETAAMLNNAHNSVEPDLGTATVPFNVQVQSNIYAAVGRGGLTSHSVQESISDAENVAYQLQSQLWQGQPCPNECAAPNNTMNGQEEPLNESGSESLANTYSQGVLDTLTQALRSSGVDLSQTSISVQFDVSKQENSRADVVAFSSKDEENLYLNNQVMEQSDFGNCNEESDHSRKRLRTQKS
ncbi:transcription factor BIM3 isoform X1 [Euphorbia lathyris]|uniref:transcription factor BIM3 isoform X1 n=1 Tax=Euphorbia lathyris TaxID=212925 RepID=UPI0033130AB5